MKLDEAKTIAEEWMSYLAPYCERVEIAGSIRRGKPEVKDIEIVCVPIMESVGDLFGDPIARVSMVDALIAEEYDNDRISILKNGPRYKQIGLPEGINLDLFIVLPPAEWGVLFLIRTGPADYSHRFVTSKHAGGMLPSNMKVKDGAIWKGDKKYSTPEESDVYNLIGIPYTEPKDRQP